MRIPGLYLYNIYTIIYHSLVYVCVCNGYNDENFRLGASFMIIERAETRSKQKDEMRSIKSRNHQSNEPALFLYIFFFPYTSYIILFSRRDYIRLKLINTAESLIGSAGILCCLAARPKDIPTHTHTYPNDPPLHKVSTYVNF